MFGTVMCDHPIQCPMFHAVSIVTALPFYTESQGHTGVCSMISCGMAVISCGALPWTMSSIVLIVAGDEASWYLNVSNSTVDAGKTALTAVTAQRTNVYTQK